MSDKRIGLLDAALALMEGLPKNREQFLKFYWEAMNLNAEKCVIKTTVIHLKLEESDPDALIPYNHFRPRSDFFMLYSLQLRQAMRTWMLISNRLRFPKDMRHFICDYITRRNEAEWTYGCIVCGKPVRFAYSNCGHWSCKCRLQACDFMMSRRHGHQVRAIICHKDPMNANPGAKCFNHTPKDQREVQVKVKRK